MSSLNALSRAQYEEAKLRSTLRSCCHGGTIVCALIGAFGDAPVPYLAAVAALVFETAAWLLGLDGGRLQSIADTARRHVLIVEGLGVRDENLEAAFLREKFTSRAERRAPEFEDETYFASQEEPGPKRLRDWLQESAFWSAALYRRAAFRAAVPMFVFLSVSAIVVFLLFLETDDKSLIIARGLIVVLSFLPAFGELDRIIAWSSAATEATNVTRRLEHIDLTTEVPVLLVFTDYQVITAGAPLIPTGVYRSNHDRLNRLWQNRQSGNAVST